MCVLVKLQEAAEHTERPARRQRKMKASNEDNEQQLEQMDTSLDVKHGDVTVNENSEVQGNSDMVDMDDSEDPTSGTSGSTRVHRVENCYRASPVWNYFSPRSGCAVCKLCRKLLKRSGGSTSNLYAHLKRAHRKEYATTMGEYRRRKMEEAARDMVC